MAVVIDHGDVIHHTLDVKTAAHAGKLSEALANQVSGNFQVQRNGGCRCGVADIMHARRVRELEQAEIFALVSQAELAAQTLQLRVADHQISLARRSIRDDGTLYGGEKTLPPTQLETHQRCSAQSHPSP